MFTLNNFAVLALAGTTIAAPALKERGWQGGWGGWRSGGWNHGSDSASTSTVWDIATATVTMTGEAPTFTYAPPASTPAPAPETTVVATTAAPSASAAAFYGGGNAWGSSAAYSAPAASAPAASSYAAPAPSASSAPSTGSSTDGYMDVVSKWRAAGGLKALIQDSTLEANAAKTANDGNGAMVHELNSGSMAQVLAPGDASNFESVYVGGWLCESPNLPGLNGACATMEKGWDHSNGETGHADILTSGSYSKIGCALEKGIWACDLA